MSYRLAFQNANVRKRMNGEVIPILEKVNFTFPNHAISLVVDDQMRRIFIDLFSGRLPLEQGKLIGLSQISHALGSIRAFSIALSAQAMIEHLCIIYTIDRKKTKQFFSFMLSNPHLLQQRMDHWPVQDRIEFSLIAGLLYPFQAYLLEARLTGANHDFFQRWGGYFLKRIKNKPVIIASRHLAFHKNFAKNAIIVKNGQLISLDNVELAHQLLQTKANEVEEED